MKPTPKLLMIFSLFSVLFLSCQTNSTDEVAFSEEQEKAAILKVIEDETKCFFGGDYDCWASNWSQEKYSMQAWNTEDGSYDAVVGWNEIDRQGKYWIRRYYEDGQNIVYPFVKRENMIVKFFNPTTAYLVWKQYNANADTTMYQVSQESRLLEKKNGEWKIVNVTAFWDTASAIPVDSVKIE